MEKKQVFFTHRQIGANEPKCEIVVFWLYSSDTNWQQLGEHQPSSIVSDLFVCVFIRSSNCHNKVRHGRSKECPCHARCFTKCFMFSVPANTSCGNLSQDDKSRAYQEQLMMFKTVPFWPWFPTRFFAFLPDSSDNTRDSPTLHLPQVLPTWMLKCNFPSTAFRSRGWESWALNQRCVGNCWQMENRDRPESRVTVKNHNELPKT